MYLETEHPVRARIPVLHVGTWKRDTAPVSGAGAIMMYCGRGQIRGIRMLI